jgi:hypothetical protein
MLQIVQPRRLQTPKTSNTKSLAEQYRVSIKK